MGTDGVTRRRVMKGISTIAGAIVVGKGESSSYRGPPSQTSGYSVRSEVDSTSKRWPQSGGIAAKTGHRRGIRGPKSSVAFRWRFEDAPRISDVVVVESIVYGSDEATLYALSAEDGSEIWTTGHEDEDALTSVSAPAVDDAFVYAGYTCYTDHIDRTGCTNCICCTSCTDHTRSTTDSHGHSHVIAFDAETGTRAWRFEPERAASKFHSPTVAESVVYIVGGNFGAGTVGRLYALEGASGELLWTKETGASGISGYEAAPVAVDRGIVYLAADSLYALDASTGEVHWSVDSDVTYKSTGKNAPAVADGRLYVGRGTETASTFEARYTSDGSRAWTHTVGTETKTESGRNESIHTRSMTGTWTAAAVYDGTVYVGFNERTTRKERTSLVIALSADDGTVRWQRAFRDDRFTVHTPAIANETLYTGGAALQLDDGSVRWRLDTPASDRMNDFSPPAVADETVYVGGTSLQAITGRI